MGRQEAKAGDRDVVRSGSDTVVIGRPDPTTWLRVTAKLWLGLLGLFAFGRIVFVVSHRALLSEEHWSLTDLATAFIFGARVDAAVTSWLLIPLALASLLWIKPRDQIWMRRGSRAFRAYAIAAFALCWGACIYRLPFAPLIFAAGVALTSWFVIVVTRLSTLRLVQGDKPRRALVIVLVFSALAIAGMPRPAPPTLPHPFIDRLPANALRQVFEAPSVRQIPF